MVLHPKLGQRGFVDQLAGVTLVFLLAAVAFSAYWASTIKPEIITPQPPVVTPPRLAEFKDKPIAAFESCSALAESFKQTQSRGYGMADIAMGMISPMMASTGSAAKSESAAQSYSTTNIQVQGADEADIVKTDGKYLHIISRNAFVIVDAFPAENAAVVSKTDLKDLQVQELFLDSERNQIVLFGHQNVQLDDRLLPVIENPSNPQTGAGAPQSDAIIEPVYPQYNWKNLAVIQVLDISNPALPVVKKTVELEGAYLTSRKIGSFVYFAVNSYPQYWILNQQNQKDQPPMDDIVPLYREQAGNATPLKRFAPVAPCESVGYLEPVQARSLITIGSLNLGNIENEIEKRTVAGSGENVFASLSNLYIAQTEYDYGIKPLVQQAVRQIVPVPLPQTTSEQTVFHKFNLQDGKIGYAGSGSAPGHLLNQFSMDESNGYFRAATTIGEVWNTAQPSTNNVYVFDSDLKIIGRLEGLAPGEKIYSARFLGNRAYLVTFKKVDPLFVLDLSEPTNPRVLGQLKIPGYSDYLHPLDETHIIGVGKDAVDAEIELANQRGFDFAWYQGLKLAVFDVSDVANPKELHKIIIGDRGTDSQALHDHKAFLFDQEKELLVLPVTLAEIPQEQKTDAYKGRAYGHFAFQGAYVYRLTVENGFEFKGRISHLDSLETLQKSGYYYSNYGDTVERAGYLDNALWTLSQNKVLFNRLDDLSEINAVRINESGQPYYGYDR